MEFVLTTDDPLDGWSFSQSSTDDPLIFHCSSETQCTYRSPAKRIRHQRRVLDGTKMSKKWLAEFAPMVKVPKSALAGNEAPEAYTFDNSQPP